MNLTFNSSHLSIKGFPTVDLPPFTLITGLNGSGKTHLLDAINRGAIGVDIVSNPSAEIRLFDWLTMVPQNASTFDGHTLLQERIALANHFVGNVQQQVERVLVVARKYNLLGDPVRSVRTLAALTSADYSRILGDAQRAKVVESEMQSAFVAATGKFMRNLPTNEGRSQIELLSRELQVPILALTRDDIESNALPSWGGTTLFQQSFARLFVAYRDLLVDNEFAQFRQSKGAKNVRALTDEEFLERYMAPPWEFVNDALKSAQLDFEISAPNLGDKMAYTPHLKKRSTDAEISFDALSSGEKILMSFAFCLYYASDKRQLAQQPRLLLLDEIDAPLHPSMARGLIRTIVETLVEKLGISVIATTHAASTVAMAPDEAIYVMDASRPGLHKVTKSEALNALTVGVPTLAISHDGRRQVFVESPNDAEVYDGVFQLLKPVLTSERSLEFISTGASNGAGTSHANTGCAAVARIVTDLARTGNGTVYGLIDWDGRNSSTRRIRVFAEGRRNGLENVLFDPLLVACLIARDARASAEAIGLSSKDSYLNVLAFDAEKLQKLVRAVQGLILESEPQETAEARYAGGLVLKHDLNYFQLDDHALEARILRIVPQLNAISKSRSGALMKHVMNTVLSDKPEFIPCEFEDAFKEILGYSSH